MQDFWYQNITKIIFGRNKVLQIGEVTKPYGTKSLLVYGQNSIHKQGLYHTVKDALKENGINIIDHGGVKSNPLLSHVRLGIEKTRLNNIDCIIAVGGGSVIDEAKAISAGACATDDIWDFFMSGKKLDTALPILAVPTLSASGSEMNGGVVVTNGETKQKLAIGAPCLYPKVSILDPLLTCNAPREYTFYGLADIVSHILEPYFNGSDNHTKVQDNLAEGLLLSLIDISKRLREDLQDYQARADLMWASCLAHNGLFAAGVGRITHEIHLLAHALGAVFDVPHGAAISVVIPAWMAFVSALKGDKFCRFSIRVFGVDEDADRKKVIELGISNLKKWFSYMGCPVTLRELGITENDLELIAGNIAPVIKRINLQHIDEDAVRNIFRLCL